MGNTYFSSGITDADYQSVFVVTYQDISESDYTALMEHYQSESTGTDENGFLLFEWGRLTAKMEDQSISVSAYMN